ncbi:MAG: hypothetical protein IJZ19_00545 [Lentisphaeria bacterium]|nr:hypothetical protein [Lentisphaeria bacterium]
MSVFLPVAIPVLGALLIISSGRSVKRCAWMLAATGTLHLLSVLLLIFHPSVNEYLGADAMGYVVLTLASILFFCVSWHICKWMPATLEFEGDKTMSPRVFASLFAVFLATMSLTALARNFGLLWVAVEATTLASAPLIIFRKTPHSLEAMWKYLLICSVGIGLALFGTMLLGVASYGSHAGLNMKLLTEYSGKMNEPWFRAAFIFCFAGYGLKMGLAPFHTWLPDAHGEAPAMLSALLSGALLNCAFLGMIRIAGVAPEALNGFCNNFFVVFGMISLTVAAVFIVRQRDFKRMLAYSSVEHMGLLALLWGLGLDQIAVIHMAGHSLNKMTLFLLAGSILVAYKTHHVKDVCCMFGRIPKTALFWLVGVLFICGTPPSPLFISELFLVRGAGLWLGGAILLLLFVIFCGMTANVLKMCMGEPSAAEENQTADKAAEGLLFIPALVIVLLTVGGCLLLCNMVR